MVKVEEAALSLHLLILGQVAIERLLYEQIELTNVHYKLVYIVYFDLPPPHTRPFQLFFSPTNTVASEVYKPERSVFKFTLLWSNFLPFPSPLFLLSHLFPLHIQFHFSPISGFSTLRNKLYLGGKCKKFLVLLPTYFPSAFSIFYFVFLFYLLFPQIHIPSKIHGNGNGN